MAAPTCVALLRGINVGSHNRMSMEALRASGASLGWEHLATYLQSGNLLFAPPEPGDAHPIDPDGLATDLERTLADRVGLVVPVVVVGAEELARVVALLPWTDAFDPKKLHVVFRRSPLTADQRAEVERVCAAAKPGDEVVVPAEERWSYLRTPGGLGRSDLAARLGRSSRLPGGTARNWSTVAALAEAVSR